MPIIASNIDANRDFLGDDTVYVCPKSEVDFVNALEFTIENPDKMQEFVAVNYQKILDKYTWDKVALKYVDYLKTIVK